MKNYVRACVKDSSYNPAPIHKTAVVSLLIAKSYWGNTSEVRFFHW